MAKELMGALPSLILVSGRKPPNLNSGKFLLEFQAF
jgi:hypothetical protein